MSSVVPGYEYDIFISYRQKDNRHDGWVTEFVDHLKKELEATFKEDISVYFDFNPHDGLLETHDVDESLKSKLNCLVFIPIISRTYCDPKSFAWEHEFKAFIELASHDRIGLKVKLPGGNIASRVFPVLVHDLDGADNKLFESALGGPCRGIGFIYKSPGVNRPLRPSEEYPDANTNRYIYRDQINKVALAIRDILSGMRASTGKLPDESDGIFPAKTKAMISDKSIIVLPFSNMSSDPDQDYFSDGLTEEIITDLSHIRNLLVISRSSAMTFKGTGKKIRDIAEEVNVHYVLEGSVRKAGNNLRITAQLIDGITDTHLWAEKFSGTLDDVFDIQEKVSRSIADSLMIKLSPAETRQMAEHPIENPQAYELYLRGLREMHCPNEASFEKALKDFHAGLEITGDNARFFAGIGTIYCNFYEFGIRATEEELIRAEKYALKVLELAPGSSASYSLLGRIERFRGNAIKAIRYFRQAIDLDPHDPEAQLFLVLDYLVKAGRPQAAKTILNQLLVRDPLSPMTHLVAGAVWFYEFKTEMALQAFGKMAELDPESVLPEFWITMSMLWAGQHDKAFERIDRIPPLDSADPVFRIFNGWLLFMKYALLGEKEKAVGYLTEDLISFFWNDPDFPWLGTGGYALIHENEEALRWLEHCIGKGNINYPLFSRIDPFMENIRGEERFKQLMERIRVEWEKFPD